MRILSSPALVASGLPNEPETESDIAADVSRGPSRRHHEVILTLLSSSNVLAPYRSTSTWYSGARAPERGTREYDAWLFNQDPYVLNPVQKSELARLRKAGFAPPPAVPVSATAAAAAAAEVASTVAAASAAASAATAATAATAEAGAAGAVPSAPAPIRHYAQNSLGETILHYAVNNRDSITLALLLVFQVVPDSIENDAGQTAGMLARINRDPEIFDMFKRASMLESNAAARVAGRTLNQLVCTPGIDLFVVRAVLNNNRFIVVNAPDDDSRKSRPLHNATRMRRLDIVALLLSHGADPLAYDRLGHSALALAARLGLAPFVRLMLSSPTVVRSMSGPAPVPQADPNNGWTTDWTNANGETLLHLAVLGGHPDVIRYILAFPFGRALVERTNNQGMRPIDLCTSATTVSVFNEAMISAIRAGGLETPRAAEPSFGAARVCAICTMPALDDNSIVFDCECGAFVCDGCFGHLAGTAINAGTLPRCSNLRCSHLIPLATLVKRIPVSQVLIVLAIALNEKMSIDSTYKMQCPVCYRGNDIRNVIASSPTPRHKCVHCGVFFCTVCSAIYPQVANPITPSDLARNSMDDAVHKSCVVKFGSLQMFAHMNKVLDTKGVRSCPRCGLGGFKDDRCNHAHCDNGCPDFCYVCGRSSDQLNQMSVNSHATYSGPWQTDPSYCPMYLHHMAMIERERIGNMASSCRNPDCRPNGSCPNDTQCRVSRDTAVSALLNQIRVRCYLLMMIHRAGKAKFGEMLDRFGWRPMIDGNFFNGRFPWEGDEIPQWWSFEPPNMQAFYKVRLRWFVLPGDLAEFIRVVGPDCDHLPAANAGNAGGGGRT